VTTTTHRPSRSCYQRGCRLPECVRINYRYEKGLKYDHTRGRRRQIDAQQVRVHIERLRAADWTPLQIASAAHASRSVIYSLAAGQPEVRSHIALAILSVPIGPPPKPGIDATGTARRIRALVAIGHTMRTVAAETGYGHNTIEKIAAGLVDTVTPSTAETIAGVYRRLRLKPGTSAHAKAFARKNNWDGPLSWDDIDDPNEKPEKSAPYEASSKYERDPDKTREIEHLYLLGESPEQIAKRFDGNEKYIRDQVGAIKRQRAAKAAREKAAKAGLEAAA
jgi:transposase